MSRIVAVAPLLRDAALSCGGTLARHAADGHEVVVVSAFSRPGGAADDGAIAALGLHGAVHLGVAPAAERGYDGELAAYDGVRAGDDVATVVSAVLAVALAQLRPELLLAPLGLGGHVDQVALAAALDDLGLPRLRWLDLPYALRRTPGAALGAGEVVLVPVADHLEAKAAAAVLLAPETAEDLVRHAIAEGERTGAGGPVEVLVRRDDAPGEAEARASRSVR